MPDTAERLAGPIAGTGVAATLYTVPASTTTIVRAIHITNTAATAATFDLSIGADAVGTRFWSDESIPGTRSLDWSGFLVLATTETLRWIAPTTMTITVSGVEVT